MSVMANITVKKADGTTDIVYTAAAASAGDSIPAVWRSNSVSTIIAHRPKLTLSLRDNATKTGRAFQLALLYPHVFTNVGSGEITLLGNSLFRCEGLLFSGIDAAAKKEMIYQGGNLLVSSLIRAALEEEYAPS